VSVANAIASQKAEHGVAHATACRALGVSQSWFYKWHDRPPTPRQQRRAELDAAVKAVFDAHLGRYGSPRVHAELAERGWRVSVNTVAGSMARQQLVARPKRRRRGLTRADKRARKFPDLLGRDFTAAAPNRKWTGDLTEIPTDEGVLYLASTEDLFSRRVLGAATNAHHDAAVAVAALQMAAAVRGGRDSIAGVIFHSDQGGEYTAAAFTTAARDLGVRQSMGRVASALDNAAHESFHSTLEFELLARRRFATRAQARAEVMTFIDYYNRVRRHSTNGMRSPIDFENTAAGLKEEVA
jgi:transposase InsO family protein